MSSSYFHQCFHVSILSIFPSFLFCVIHDLIYYFFPKISGYGPQSLVSVVIIAQSIFRRIICFFMVSERLVPGTSSPLHCSLFPTGFHLLTFVQPLLFVNLNCRHHFSEGTNLVLVLLVPCWPSLRFLFFSISSIIFLLLMSETCNIFHSKSWVIDFGVIDHMTHCPNKFDNYIPVPRNRKIFVADGSAISIDGHGNIFTFLLSLPNVLHVPKLSTNLLSIHKITKDLNKSAL